MKDPEGLSGRYAQEAVRKVQTSDGMPPEAALLSRPDPKVPGANYVDGPGHQRYWVGLQGEVHRTGTTTAPQTRDSGFQQARTRYTGAVEKVRLHYRTPVTDQLFAVPDTHVPEAFFVYDAEEAQTVRWVSPDGEVLDGYQHLDGAPRWDEATVAARTRALERALGTAPLADD